MANEVRFDIVATDKASAQLDDVADKAAGVEKLDPTVDVTADTRDADHSVTGFEDQLAKLTDADKIVVLALRAGAASSELADLATQIATIDSSDPSVSVTFDRYAEVSGQLDHLEQQMKDVAGTSLDPDVGGKAVERLQSVGAEAGKTSDAVHSMAGNAIGDFAATATGIGPLGEALGQVTEAALAGEAGIKGIATAGLGMGALSLAMIGVNKVMGEFEKTAQRASEIKAFNTSDVEAFTKALTTGKDAVSDYVDRMTELGKVTTVATSAAGLLAGSFRDTTDIAPDLAAAGVSMQQFAEAVTGTQDDLDRFDAAVSAVGLSADQTNRIISGAQTEFDNYAVAQENASKFALVFGDSTEESTGKVVAHVGRIQAGLDKLKTWDQANKDIADSMKDVSRETDGSTRAFKTFTDTIDQSQSLIDLDDQLAGVKQAATDYMNAQLAANSATGDQAAKADAAAQSQRDYQTEINNTKREIIQLGQTAGATPVEVQTALQKIDNGDLAGAKADAESWFNRNPVKVAMTPDQARLIAGLKGLAGLSIAGASTSSTTVNNYMAAAATGRQLRTTQARYARVRGR